MAPAAGPSAGAACAINARLPDTAKIGGVRVPPELRGCGYGRTVVAGALLATRRAGAERAGLLFTGNATRQRGARTGVSGSTSSATT